MRGSKGGGPDPISPSENSKLHSKITKNIHWTPSPSPKQT